MRYLHCTYAWFFCETVFDLNKYHKIFVKSCQISLNFGQIAQKLTTRFIYYEVSLKRCHWLFFRGGAAVHIVDYTSKNLLSQYKSTIYCIFVAITESYRYKSGDKKTGRRGGHRVFKWYFVTKIVLTYCEKKLL